MRYALFCFFFFNDTATTEIYTLSLHDALPILRFSRYDQFVVPRARSGVDREQRRARRASRPFERSERQRDRKSTRLNSSHANISYAVFCLKKKKHKTYNTHIAPDLYARELNVL